MQVSVFGYRAFMRLLPKSYPLITVRNTSVGYYQYTIVVVLKLSSCIDLRTTIKVHSLRCVNEKAETKVELCFIVIGNKECNVGKMVKKGSWFSAIKRVFTPHSKEKRGNVSLILPKKALL